MKPALDWLIEVSAGTCGFGVNWLVQSTLLVGLGLLAARLLRRRGSAIQSAVYRTTLVAVLAGPLSTLLLSAAGVRGLSLDLPEVAVLGRSRARAEAPAPRSTPLASQSGPFESEDVRRAPSGAELGGSTETSHHPTQDAAPMEERTTRAVAAPAVSARESAKRTANAPLTLVDLSIAAAVVLAACVWLVGSAVLLARLARAYNDTRRMCRGASPADASTLRVCSKLANRMGVRPPRVGRTAFVSSPCLVGVRRPVILLPEEPCSMPLHDVLVHELAHLRRHDIGWKLVERLALAVFFYQPLLWLLARRLEASAEQVCDDYVVHFGADPQHYADQLVDLAALALPPAAGLGVGVVSLKSLLAGRVRRILDTSRKLSIKASRSAFYGILLFGGATTLLAGFVGSRGTARPAEARPQSTQHANREVIAQQEHLTAADAIQELGRRYEAQQAKYAEAVNEATTADERYEVFRKYHPVNTFTDELLAIEEKYRGQPAAVSALYRLMSNAVGVGDPDFPASQGREKAIKILGDYYIDHPDLDLLFSFFEGGAFVPEAEALLRKATESPHDPVRAAARYHLASFLVHKTRLVTSKRARASRPEPDEPAIVAEVNRKFREQIRRLGPIDPVRVREEALRLTEKILQEDAHIHQSWARTEGPGSLMMRRVRLDELATDKPPTYGTRAESLRFELKYLQEGRIAPDIEGTDADGLKFKLSDYRGRVVLLMFSAGWCGPCKAMYPDIRKLQEVLADEPFSVLAVMGDHNIDSVIRDVELGDIRWRTWFDGYNGPIATRWNVTRWPTLYLLDHNGRIVEREPGRKLVELKQTVETALTAVKQDPSAKELQADRPLPELPILRRAREAAVLRDRIEQSFEVNLGIERVSSLAIDKDERFLAVGGWEFHGTLSREERMKAWRKGKATGIVQLWDAAKREKLRDLEGLYGAVSVVALSPDGQWLASAGHAVGNRERGHVNLWNVKTGELVRSIDKPMGGVLGAAFSPDGSLLATGGFDKTPRIWSVPSGDEIAKLPEQPSFSDHFAFTPDGRQLIVPTRKGNVTIWDTATWTQQKELKADNLFLLAASLSPDGRVFAVGGHDPQNAEKGRVILWDLQSGEVLASFDTKNGVSGLDFSPDGSLLAAAGMSPDVTIWNWADNRVHAWFPAISRSSDNEVVFLPKSGRLMTKGRPEGRLLFYQFFE